MHDDMDPLLFYSCCCGAILFISRLYGFVRHLPIKLWYKKHLQLPYAFRRRRLVGPITRTQLLLLLFHWVGTAACNVVGTQSRSHIASRAGALAVLHFLPLFLGNRLSLSANLMGVSLRAYLLIHRAIGWMAIVQSMVHVALTTSAMKLNLQKTEQKYGFVVCDF